MSRKVVALLLLIMFVVSSNAYAADSKIAVYLDGNELTFDTPPIITDGTTLVPLRKIFETLGSQIQWDNTTRTVTATKGDILITYKIGEKNGYKNGKSVTLEVPGVISNGSTLVPLRFVSEALGALVAWNGETKRIDITHHENVTAEVKATETSYIPSINRLNGSQVGSVYVDGNWIYYTHPMDERKIYKMKLDGSMNTKIGDKVSTNHLIVDKDWIYFSTFEVIGHPRDFNLSPENGVYKMKTDGSGLQKLLSGTSIGAMSLTGETIYYTKQFDTSNVNMVKTDGTGNQLAYKNVWNYQVVGDTLYYNQESRLPVDFYEMKLDGTNKRKLMRNISPRYQVINNSLFYTDGSYLMERLINEPEKEPTKIIELNTYNLVVVDEHTVIFQKKNDNKLYKVDLISKNVTLLHESAVQSFDVAGDFIKVTFANPITFSWINWKTKDIVEFR
ncbi:stalk domain-containing protein [Paenibacillus qinlingensis]|uniref:Copper amine oxidase-like N-terminal domain-containing protein n=1 Tax=Paenibacillus qinlingensis TaxID=1837343 RepID=A0ABU1NX36_9BACL|nr:DUF5050 domain-containing protein [Paenibacillus qinlingensis]MDR6551552.1 hypothetical protein [Paenibacillus qinlingensis]